MKNSYLDPTCSDIPSSGLKDWPSYGYFPYNGRYFRMYRGNSNKQFSDVPSASILRLIENLSQIERESDKIDDFKRKALCEIQNLTLI